MNYTLKPVKENYVSVYINADSNDWDLMATNSKYDISILDDIDFIISVKAMQDLLNVDKEERNHNLEGCFQIWNKMYGEDVMEYLEGILTENLDIPRNDWDYGFCHTLYNFDVKVYKDGALYNLIVDKMPDIPEEEV